MHVQYVGIGILIDLKLCFNIGLSPPTVGNCDKLFIIYFQCNVLSDTFCSDKWTNKNEMAIILRLYKVWAEIRKMMIKFM